MDNGDKINIAMGIVELICALGILTGFKKIGLLAIGYLIFTIVFLGNPLLAFNQQDLFKQNNDYLTDVILIGGVMVICFQ